MKKTMIHISIYTTAIVLFLFSTAFKVSSSVEIQGQEKEEVSEQIWAVEIEAEPGESGSLEQDFEAAEGPYDPDLKAGVSDEVKEDAYGFDYDQEGRLEVAKGDQYVGSYFEIEQEASTTGGTTKRYIDISSPWTGAYLYEDMVVEGSANIKETFEMENLAPGADAIPTWEDLF